MTNLITTALAASLLLGGSVLSYAQIVVEHADGGFSAESASVIEPYADGGFDLDNAPLFDRTIEIADPTKLPSLSGALGHAGQIANLPAPSLLGLSKDWQPLGAFNAPRLYVYGKDIAAKVSINNVKPPNSVGVAFDQLSLQLLDENGDIIELNFSEGSVINNLVVFDEAGNQIDLRAYSKAQKPLGIVMLFDRSGSMGSTGVAQQHFVDEFGKQLKGDFGCMIGYFTKDTKFRGNSFEECKALLNAAHSTLITDRPFGGGTDVYQSILAALNKLNAADFDQNLVVVVSDAEQWTSINTQLILDAKAVKSTKVFMLHPGSKRSNQLADVSDIEIVISDDIRNDAQQYRQLMGQFSTNLSKALEGQIFLRP